MVKYITCGVLLLFCLIACNKDNTVLNGNKFNFDLGNSYTVENSGVFTSTPRAYKAEYLYYPNELSDDIMVPFEIWLTDAEIGSVLYSCCSNHSYISPPTRRIIFNFYNCFVFKASQRVY